MHPDGASRESGCPVRPWAHVAVVSGILSVVLAASVACGASSPTQPAEVLVKVSEDRVGLTKHIAVPEPLRSVRWAAHALGAPGTGPTDLELVAVFDVDDDEWPAVEAIVGADPAATELAVPAALAEGTDLPTGPLAGRAISCAPFENHRWRCVGGVRTDEGLVVWMTSR